MIVLEELKLTLMRKTFSDPISTRPTDYMCNVVEQHSIVTSNLRRIL